MSDGVVYVYRDPFVLKTIFNAGVSVSGGGSGVDNSGTRSLFGELCCSFAISANYH